MKQRFADLARRRRGFSKQMAPGWIVPCRATLSEPLIAWLGSKRQLRDIATSRRADYEATADNYENIQSNAQKIILLPQITECMEVYCN